MKDKSYWTPFSRAWLLMPTTFVLLAVYAGSLLIRLCACWVKMKTNNLVQFMKPQLPCKESRQRFTYSKKGRGAGFKWSTFFRRLVLFLHRTVFWDLNEARFFFKRGVFLRRPVSRHQEQNPRVEFSLSIYIPGPWIVSHSSRHICIYFLRG